MFSAIFSGTAQATVSCVTQSFDGVRYLNCSNGFSGVGTDLGDAQAYAFSNGLTAVRRQSQGIAYYKFSNGSSVVSIELGGLNSYGLGAEVTAIGQSTNGIRVFNASNGVSAVSYPLSNVVVTDIRLKSSNAACPEGQALHRGACADVIGQITGKRIGRSTP